MSVFRSLPLVVALNYGEKEMPLCQMLLVILKSNSRILQCIRSINLLSTEFGNLQVRPTANIVKIGWD